MSVSKPPRLQRGMDMEAGRWSGLPFEILEQVLAFVPVPDLCRYRAVCKAWNRLITDSGFAARHNSASTSYIVMGCCRKKGTHLDQWRILDVSARRWYTVEYNERYKFMNDSNMKAMDGGLVCQYLETKAQVIAVVVHNPIAKSARVLPVAPNHVTSTSFPELSLVVDTASGGDFKVLINPSLNYREIMERPAEVRSPVCVYESATNEWRSMRIPPYIEYRDGHICRIIMFGGWLYVLLLWGLLRIGKEYHLWRYDAVADVWERVAAPVSSDYEYPDLVALGTT